VDRSTHSHAIVSLDNVSLRYGRKVVLRDVSLELKKRELVGLIGPGGSGKTQLIKVISTLVMPRGGEIRLFGHRLSRMNLKLLRQVRRRIGLQFQNFALFDYLDVWHNVAFSLQHGRTVPKDEIEERVQHALAAVGLDGTQQQLPEELSGGMRRRVAIARVMASRPELAIFDDPVAGLDPVNSARIMALIKEFGDATGSLVIVATHDLERLLPITSSVMAVFDGTIRYVGPTAEVTRCEHGLVRDFVAAATGQLDHAELSGATPGGAG